MIGPSRMALVIVFSTFGGVLLSCLTSSTNVASGSLAVLGILGATLGWFFLNWRAMAHERARWIQVIILSIMIFLLVAIGVSSATTDFASHVGAVIYGCHTALAVFPLWHILPTRTETIKQKVGRFGLAVWSALGLVLFFTVI